jgi:pyruvate formate lyase activating enzyme
MLDLPPTPPETCRRARDQAKRAGIRHVYSGNIHDVSGQSTYCPGCGTQVIERDWYDIGAYRLNGGACEKCGAAIAGRFWADGLPKQIWGRKRQRLVIA